MTGGVRVLLPQSCRLERASPESTVQGAPHAAAPDPGAESHTSRSPSPPLTQRRFLMPLLALLVSGLAAGEAAHAVLCWALRSLGGVPYGSDPGLSERAQPGLPPGEPGLSAGGKDPAGDPEPQAQGGRLVRLERRRCTRGTGVGGRWSRARAAGSSTAVQALSRGECSTSVVWGCVHTQGVNMGSPFSQSVAACALRKCQGLHPAALGSACGVCTPST